MSAAEYLSPTMNTWSLSLLSMTPSARLPVSYQPSSEIIVCGKSAIGERQTTTAMPSLAAPVATGINFA